MARKRRQEEPSGGAPEWMTTYGDMVTLLLCFFVLLFSFSEVDARKFESMIASFQGSLGILDSGTNIISGENITIVTENDLTDEELAELEGFKELEDQLDEFLKDSGLDGDMLVSMERKGLVLRFQDSVLFDSGKADIKENAKEILISVVEFLEKPEFANKEIRIEGHTDTDPLRRNARYETNWELSTARSSNVVRFLIEDMNLNPIRFSAAGYGEHHPIASNDTQENKRKNRRVDIVILRSELNSHVPVD